MAWNIRNTVSFLGKVGFGTQTPATILYGTVAACVPALAASAVGTGSAYIPGLAASSNLIVSMAKCGSGVGILTACPIAANTASLSFFSMEGITAASTVTISYVAFS